MRVFPLVQTFEGLLSDVFEAVTEEDQVVLQCFFMDRHF